MQYTRLLKAQVASLASTLVDFTLTIACVELLHVWYLAATVLGNVAGGVTNFYLGRYLVFQAARQQARGQAVRYLAVWLGSLLLNAAGVYAFTQGLHFQYIHSKVIVSLFVGIGFNYLMQLYFVFRRE